MQKAGVMGLGAAILPHKGTGGRLFPDQVQPLQGCITVDLQALPGLQSSPGGAGVVGKGAKALPVPADRDRQGPGSIIRKSAGSGYPEQAEKIRLCSFRLRER